MHGSRIARCALGDARQTCRPFEAVRNREQAGRVGAVLDMVVRDRARTWTQQEADGRTELPERRIAPSNE